MLVAICGNSKIIKIPPYIDGGMETLLNSILKYQQFKSDANYIETIELLDFFIRKLNPILKNIRLISFSYYTIYSISI